MSATAAQPGSKKNANASSAIAALAMLLLIIGGGYFAWSRWGNSADPASKDLENVDMVYPVGVHRIDGPLAGMRMGGPRGNGPRQQGGPGLTFPVPDSIRPLGKGFFIKSGAITLNVDRAATGWDYRWGYAVNTVLSPDERAIVALRTLIPRNLAAATAKGVTADQVAKLKDLPPVNVTLSADELQTVKSQFDAWYTAAGGKPGLNGPAVLPQSNSQPAKDAEKQLLATLDTISKAQAESEKKGYQDLIGQIKGILGDDLVTKLKNGG